MDEPEGAEGTRLDNSPWRFVISPKPPRQGRQNLAQSKFCDDRERHVARRTTGNSTAAHDLLRRECPRFRFDIFVPLPLVRNHTSFRATIGGPVIRMGHFCEHTAGPKEQAAAATDQVNRTECLKVTSRRIRALLHIDDSYVAGEIGRRYSG